MFVPCRSLILNVEASALACESVITANKKQDEATSLMYSRSAWITENTALSAVTSGVFWVL